MGEGLVTVKAGNHGYLSGYDPTALIVYGKNIKQKEVSNINQTDIASYIMYLLGINYSFVDGKLPISLID
jgi:hypothetical protein